MTKDEVLQLIAHHTRQVIPDLAEHVFTPSDSLRELGTNSIDRAEILMLVLETLALRIPRIELFGPRNIGELAELIHARLQAHAASPE